MTKPNHFTTHVVHPDAERIIEMGLDLFYKTWRHKKNTPVDEQTLRAVRMTDLKLLTFHALRNADLGNYQDSTRGFKTIKHLKKVYRI